MERLIGCALLITAVLGLSLIAAPPPHAVAQSSTNACYTEADTCQSRCRSRQAAEITAGLMTMGSRNPYGSRFDFEGCLANCREERDYCIEDVRAEEADRRSALASENHYRALEASVAGRTPLTRAVCSSAQGQIQVAVWQAANGSGVCSLHGALQSCAINQGVISMSGGGYTYEINRVTGQMVRRRYVDGRPDVTTYACQRDDPSAYRF